MKAFVIISCFVLCHQLATTSPVEDLLERSNPSLGGLLKRLSGPLHRLTRDVGAVEEDSDEVCYNEGAEKIKEMLRYLDKNRNQLSKFLDEQSCQSDTEETTSNVYLNPQERWIELQSALLELLSTTESTSETPEESQGDFGDAYLNADSLALSPNASWRSPADSQSREECWIDYSGFVAPITNRILSNVVNSSCQNITDPGDRQQCQDFVSFLDMNEVMPYWGKRMIDAMAKIPTTLSEGPLTWVGAYDMCHNYDVSYFHNDTAAQRDFTGKYCRLDMTTIPRVVNGTNGTTSRTLTLAFGVCVPDTCNSHDVRWYITENNTVLVQALSRLNMEITYVFCGMEDLDSSTDAHLQAALAITFLFVAIVVVATIYDGFFRKHLMKKHVKELKEHVDEHVAGTKKDRDDLMDEKPIKIRIVNRLEMCFVGFSAYTNFRKIFTIRDKPGDIPVLNGIRYLSFVYVMWGEIYVLGPIYFESWTTSNILGAVPRITQKLLFQPIINFHLSEDSFLLISGILVTYWFLRRYEANGKKLSVGSIVYYFVHRYWRLMPVMMLSIMIFTCTYKYAADGPMFPPKDTDGENCRVNWWVDLLMVHNIVKVKDQCFGHAWFVPIVFQLHVAAIVVVIPLVLKPVIGYVMIGLMYVAHIGATAGITTDLRKNRMGDWYNEYLLTPWCRAGPFIIGLAYGIIFHKRAHKGIKLHWAVSLCLWVVSLICVLLPAFASYSRYKDGGEPWSDEALIAYDTLARSSWALGLGWIALACHFDHGGVIDSFLSWKAWVPLSRLVYTTLLMHALFIMQFVYTSRMPIYIETYHMYYTLFAHLIYIMIIGLLISLIWDLPLGTGVEKAIIAKTKFHWIRAGRHPRSALDAAERRFWDFDEPPVIDRQAMSSGKPAIPGCQYVEVSPADLAKLGVTIEVRPEDGHHHQGNHHDADKHTVVYDNHAFDKDEGITKGHEEPERDYESLGSDDGIRL